MVSIYIDNKKYCVGESYNLLEVCLSLGLNIPYFCWHPALGSVGSCRQCAVKQYSSDSKSGRIVMACMTPVVDGLVISINDIEVKEFRETILELLMINHPHDCPVCSEGGHCHLQDMTVMVGHYVRRYRFMKRTHVNQYLGPFIAHEMNRCISCYRCVRYYKDYADGFDFDVYGVHDNLYFGRFQEGKLESEFSGNLVEICPTGVFTDKTSSQYYSRKWDMQFSPSICVHCSVGCNIILGERYGKICRVDNRYNGSINGYFLCDRGRFGYDYVNNMESRFKKPLHRKDKKNWIELNEEQAIAAGVKILRISNKVIGIGSPRASVESNFALMDLVGADNFYFGINRFEHRVLLLIFNILQNSGIYIASIKDIEAADAIFLLGEDVTQTSARIALAIRQSVKGGMLNVAKDKNIPIWHMNAVRSLASNTNFLFITNVDKTKLDDVAFWTYYASLNDQARFGFAVASVLDNTAPTVNDFDNNLINKVHMVAQALLKAKRPVIISGSNVGNESIISAAANIAKSLKNCGKHVSINLVVSEVNSIGLAMMNGGGSLDDALDVSKDNKIDSVIVLESDLCRHLSFKRVESFLRRINHLIVLDHQRLSFHKHANLVFSVTSVPESDGTLINQEGRAQRFFRVYNPNYYDSSLLIFESWRWLYKLRAVFCSQNQMRYLNFDDVVDRVVLNLPELSKIRLAAPHASFRIFGQKLSRAPSRYSGRTSYGTDINVHEPRVCQDEDSMFSFSMEGNNIPNFGRQHIAFVWSPGWNSPQAWNKFHSGVGNFMDSGVRIFDHSVKNERRGIDWFVNVPIVSSSLSSNSINISNNMWYVVPYWHIFGSEELSQRSLSIQKCITNPYVVLSQSDGIQFGLYDKNILVITCGDHKLSLPLVFSNKLTSGYIGLPIGLPGISHFYLGMYITNIEGKF
ncbi:NADH-quinone oxidoreductase subunit NuoG [Blochmannia endosymbiont of Polyrhachis (Hedomyrma) turneri]|uniref:NADH-quinone oxidoreductase subunit NuoG n=1 Tax=Blochmannia endosymbiont of Polyrhachis (Hedomyrma) turneri TaxID=1505596 RepID=UPI00061A7071|nr:NADH-quinone oxidoreductase subunit NuoG [Blochmannia endosymbiont of Polyrhachis (Hedomyrma) turneri]AKC60050.1 NADH-quinone oxidoreductase subunit G [Blochmannia endosymbiont of Polyrhachis (Hedomyrma) turneri]